MPDLQNLYHMLELYSRGSFGKQSDQWTKCVVKYLFESNEESGSLLVSFLTDVLARGPAHAHSAVLQILHCVVSHHLDQELPMTHKVSRDLLAVIATFIEVSS